MEVNLILVLMVLSRLAIVLHLSMKLDRSTSQVVMSSTGM
jgi:hypothetical protein